MADCNCGAFEAEDIVKYGYMMIKRPPTSTKVRIKAWQSKFFVLRDKTHSFPQRLEYYKDEAAFEFQKSWEHCFYLDNIVYIGETHSSKSHCYPIMVVCSKMGAFTLGCDTEEATVDWIQALNRVAVKVGGMASPEMWMHASVDDSPANTPELTRRAYSDVSSGASQSLEEQVPKLTRTRTINSPTTAGYFVTTRLTPDSERNNIRGDYKLRITEGEVVLQSVDRSVTVVTWPVGHLRAFKSEPAVSAGAKDMQLLTLNVGRRSATGVGLFQFFTKHGETIADEIRWQSQHAFKSAEEKRKAFVQRRTSSNSGSKSPPIVNPAKKLPRTMTAPADKLTSMLAKKDRRPLMDSPGRSRAETDPNICRKVEQNGADVAANGNETSETTTSNNSRPRSATDSSVEKAGDDEVFLTQPAYCEIDSGDAIKEEPDANDGSAYIDLLSDDTAEPIHISDPVPSRKTSNGSQTSSCSITSDDGGSMRSCSIPRNFSGQGLIPEENEMDSEGYIRCEALQTGPEENSVDSENVTEDQLFDISSAQSRGFSNSPAGLITQKTGGLELSAFNSSISRKIRENLVSQIRDPSTFPPKPKLEREVALKSENVFPPVSRTDEEDPRLHAESDSGHALLEKARDPESSKKLLDQIIAQMEKPQQHDVTELFPASTRKRNSIGTMSMETVREAQQKAKGSHSQSFSFKKHSVIEKSKSTCEVISSRALSPGPPPVPLRPDSAEVARRRACSSVGDISDELHKRPDLIGTHRSTFFAKGMKSVNPQTLMAPLRTNITGGHLSGEAAIHARLIEKTEIRDELAQSNTCRGKTGEDTSTCLIANGGNTTCSIADETIPNNTDSLEKGRVRSSEHLDEEAHGEVAKRKDSKASKFVKKVWKLAPKPRRGSNESRDIYDEYSGPSERPRRDSLSPGDAVDLQGRFSGSETSTPETSPQMKRKNSKTSPKDARKISSDDKSKKDKESSASKILRKVTKGDLKKDDSNHKSPVKKVSREESPKKDVLSNNNISKPLSPTPHKAAAPERNRKISNDEKAKEMHENHKMVDSFHRTDGQLGFVSESQRSPTDSVEDSAPALPPRKKFEPPPLPPRISKSSPSLNSITSPVHSTPPYHSTRAPQPTAPSTREGRRHSSNSSSSGRRHSSSSGQKEEFLPPPPVPPRSSQSPEPKKPQATNEQRSSGRAPVIQLTCSSPENRDDAFEKQNPDSEEGTTNATSDKTPEQGPPILSTTHQSPESLSHPVPRRPPKNERRTQAKEFFRTHASQRVYVPLSDSDGGEMEDRDFPPHSPRYGNIDEIRMAIGASEEESVRHEETNPQTLESAASNRTRSPPVQLSMDEIRVIKSQREAMHLKINLMKESSVDEDIAFESDDAKDLDEKTKPKRPSTPLNIQRNVLTLSSVSIN